MTGKAAEEARDSAEEAREKARLGARREEIMRAAARTIGQMPEAVVQAKLDQLREARNARSAREIIRQEMDADSLDGDEAAFQAGLRHEEGGDLKAAARWYRAAAVNDFPGASVKLARVLSELAAGHRARGEWQADEALTDEARQWYAIAFAAGENGVLDSAACEDDGADDAVGKDDDFDL